MKKLRGVLVLFLCVVMLLSGCTQNGDESKDVSGVNSSETSVPEQKEFDTVFRFIVASDIHVGSASSTEASRLKSLFEESYAYASTQDYKTVDAFVVVGDMTNYGSPAEYTAFKSVIDANIKEETTFIPVMGNHEFYGGYGEETYMEYIDPELNKHVVVKGYHFIGLSTHGEGQYDAEKIKWLNTQLKEAAEDDPDKPIITFQHHHIKDTVYVSSEWYTGDSSILNAAYSQYSQVINFSGHSHGPVNNPTSVYQDKYTLFGTGTLSYFEMTSGMTYGTIPPNANNAAQFYIVEVSDENAVRVLPYNLLTGDFFKEPSQSGKQLIYYIDDLKDRSTWLYTEEARSSDEAPCFADDAGVVVSDVTTRSIKVSFPQATDDSCVYSYDIICTPVDGGTASTFKYFSEYYFEPMPQKLEFVLSGLKDGTKYDLSVVPVDCYGNKGEGISGSFETPEGEKIIYTSKNPVNFSGTFTNFDSAETLTSSSGTPAYGGVLGGDVFAGDWSSGTKNPGSSFELVSEGGYQNSAAIAVSSNNKDNQGLYVFATEENGNATMFPDVNYLRVWVDFTGVDFRKANFGLMSETGALFTTDECDGRDDLEFYYLPEGSEEWQTFTHGSDGCFGTAEGSSVKDFKGWMAFPVKDFIYRSNTGSGTEGSGVSYPYNKVAGVYMFWDYEDSMTAGVPFLIDEIQIVGDYTEFVEYEAE